MAYLDITPANERTSYNLVWDTNTLAFVKMTQPTGGGAGGGTVDQGTGGISAWKVDGSAVTQPVSLASMPSTPVTGTFWQATQPVSGTFFQATQPVSIASMPSTPVTGAFFQATQPVSLASAPSTPVTNAGLSNIPAQGQALAAGSMPVVLPAAQVTALTPPAAITGFALDSSLVTLNGRTPALGQATMANSRPVVIASNQSTLPVSIAAAAVTFKGRACCFRTPGRAGTAGQKILSLHNATGSAVTVTVTHVFIDLVQTVIKAVTVLPPVVRCWMVTVLPTNGTALTKNQTGGSGASSASVTVLNDASADGTNSTTALTATLPTGTFVSQEFAPRFITAAGYEMSDRIEFFGNGETVTLGALQGIVIVLDYVLATQNPTTDMWVAGLEWTEA